MWGVEMDYPKEDIRDELQVREDYGEFLHIGLMDKTNEELESMLNPNRRLWARIGMSLEVTEEEYEEICALLKDNPEKAAHWLYEKFASMGSFDGDSYLPIDADDNPNTEVFTF